MIRLLLAILMTLTMSVKLALGDQSTYPKLTFSSRPFEVPKILTGTIDSDYRSSWHRLTGFELSGLHWHQFVVVYSNIGAEQYAHNFRSYIMRIESDDYGDEMDESIQSMTYVKFRPGTIFLKENFSMFKGVPAKPLTLTVMIKHEPGYDANNGDWEYIEIDSLGHVLQRGNTSNDTINGKCAACHKNIAERDYIFSTFYSQ